ncbi:hypothetical protein A3A93_02075 [Candidatus Roizmanbacteria bacterium RIFCSPLOWO2_01_FULL_38_12]|uniref:50S ribosomal protein L29 n=1 Tax=Candidatus Roizmanbacteria bacterium RIFCSPLOWO2_01_FULL_38_12 TaxID=1802061 RepID=A0A1F7IY21_9BACT|nr:MAG: hypothetical protein A3F59_03260 [Candidatus Roizmanbacteria bacterium RIFCSPHIGHO2_12_FULL_38_13]OGK48237.1 MAG: hypothetical protein A3A93_02075 [Candidatus Roizmanbacteria bacterium RIFCSPLOWO2_01_FULL_38_12]
MKKLTKELYAKSIDDLNKEVVALGSEIAKLKVERKVKQEKDTNWLFKKQKRLAAILTMITNKESEVSAKGGLSSGQKQ